MKIARSSLTRISLVLVVVAAAAAVLAAPAFGFDVPKFNEFIPVFASPVGYAAGDGPHDLVVADFNLDGLPDVAAPNFRGDTVSVALGVAGGKFAAAKNVKVGDRPSQVVSADFNRDGKPDLAVVNRGGNSVTVLLNNGSGVFTAGAPIAVGKRPMGIAAGDVDRNGRPDVVVTNYEGTGTTDGTGSFTVLLGAGNGTFTATEHVLPHDPLGISVFGPRSVAIGDITGDGNPDLVMAVIAKGFSTFSSNLGVWAGDGSGAFGDAPTRRTIVADGPLDIEICDQDRDGALEVVGASWTGNEVNDQTKVWIYDGDAVTALFGFEDVNGVYPASLAVGELTNPANLDVAVALPGRNTVRVTADKDGVTNVPAGERPWAVALADIDRDGALDLVTAAFDGDKIEVMRRQLPVRHGLAYDPTVATTNIDESPLTHLLGGDFERDGALDMITGTLSLSGTPTGHFPDSSDLLAGDPACSGDFNRDGMLDFVSAVTAGNSVALFLGDGTGHFAAPVSFAAGASPVAAVAGDLDRNGTLDLVVANQGAATVSVLLGDGAGSFGAKTDFAVGAAPVDVALADLDSDGDLDVVAANGGAATVSVLLNNGSGSLGARTDFTAGAGSSSLATADFNRDGSADVAVGRAVDQVSVLLGNGGGGLGAATDFTAAAGSGTVVAADLTTDGIPDLVAAGGGAATSDVSVLVGNGSGGFATAASRDVFTGATESLVAADATSDGVPDVILGGPDAANPGRSGIYVLPTDTVPPATHYNDQEPQEGADFWWTNKPFTVLFDAVDDGAGVLHTRYKTATRNVPTGWQTGSQFTIVASTDHKNDGIHPFVHYSVDNVGNIEYINPLTESDQVPERIGIDTVKPKVGYSVATAAGVKIASGDWTGAEETLVRLEIKDVALAVTADISGPLEPYPFMVGLSNEWSLRKGEIVVPGYQDHSNDGVHTIPFIGYDKAGNHTSANAIVRVDTRRPRTYAVNSVSIPYYGSPTLRYKVTDETPNGGYAVATILIKNSKGKVVKTLSAGRISLGTTGSFEFWCKLARGTYRWYVTATDAAGNPQNVTGSNKLVVR